MEASWGEAGDQLSQFVQDSELDELVTAGGASLAALPLREPGCLTGTWITRDVISNKCGALY